MNAKTGKSIALGIALCAAVATLSVAVSKRNELAQSRRELETARAQAARKSGELERLHLRIADLETQLSGSETSVSEPKPTETAKTPLSIETQLESAKKLAAANRDAEALATFLDCLEAPVRWQDFSSINNLFSQLALLAERYPPAVEALKRIRRDTEQRWRADSGDFQSFYIWSKANDCLGDNERTIEVFEEFAERDDRPAGLGSYAFDELVKRQRYEDAAKAHSYSMARSQLEGSIYGLRRIDAAKRNERWSSTLQEAASEIEALAGAGQAEKALELADRLFEYDSSPETIDVVAQRLRRAGKGFLVAMLEPKPTAKPSTPGPK